MRRDPEHSAAYKAYIASPAWARKKTEYFRVHGRACQACRSADRIHVHHVSYEHLGDEPLEDLIGLCEACHGLVHSLHDAHGGDLRDITARFVADTRAAATSPVGTLATKKPRRPKQSKRLARYNKRLVAACRARNDTCPHPAPSGSGYCWEHDPNLGQERAAPNPGTAGLTPRQVAAIERDRKARVALEQRRAKRPKP